MSLFMFNTMSQGLEIGRVENLLSPIPAPYFPPLDSLPQYQQTIPPHHPSLIPTHILPLSLTIQSLSSIPPLNPTPQYRP